MSKIEEYMSAKRHAEEAREFAEACNYDQPHDSRQFLDKFGASVTISRTWRGYYGDSSTYEWPTTMTEELVVQIKIELRTLMQHVAERLGDEAEKKRIEAADEARQVLADTGEAKA